MTVKIEMGMAVKRQWEADSINADEADDDDYGTVVATAVVVLVGQEHKGGSVTSDFSPIPPTSQVLIDSINRKRGGERGRESPDVGAFRVKSAYVMTCSLAD